MKWQRRRFDEDSGETLLEVLVAVFILGVAAVAIATGMTVSIKLSDYHRKQANASAVLHNYAETLESGYVPCTAGNSQPYSLPAKPGFTTPSISVSYWAGTSFSTTTCPSGVDPGVQRVRLMISSTDSRVTESLTVVLRQP